MAWFGDENLKLQNNYGILTRRLNVKSKTNIIPDDLILCINDFKKSLNGQTISIHGKDYATVALRLAVLRRNLGAKATIDTAIVSIDKDTVVCKATFPFGGTLIATGLLKRDVLLQE